MTKDKKLALGFAYLALAFQFVAAGSIARDIVRDAHQAPASYVDQSRSPALGATK